MVTELLEQQIEMVKLRMQVGRNMTKGQTKNNQKLKFQSTRTNPVCELLEGGQMRPWGISGL